MVAIHRETLPPFVVSAPGKAILFGEHAVVYGKTAIAGSLDMRAYGLVTPRNDAKLRLVLPDINIDVLFDVHALPRLHADNLGHPGEVEGLVPETIRIPEGPGRTAVLAFVYLFGCLFAGDRERGFTVCVRSLLPVGSGLGSSAALNVTLAAALLRLSGQITEDLSDGDRELVNSWAFRGEQVAHGTPSGIDNTVATFGGFLQYTKGQPLVMLSSSHALSVLITNTKVPKSTKAMVEGVRALRDKYPEIVNNMLDSIHGIALRAVELFNQDELEQQMQDIIGMNHGLLATLGVSHPKLERIREITGAAGLASKLTGAGGGGCALTFVPNSIVGSRAVAKVATDLENEGLECYQTIVGGAGVSFACGQDSIELWVRRMLERHLSLVPSGSSKGDLADEFGGIVSGFSILPGAVIAMLAPRQIH
ncbi:Mevalonate kinase [Coemansia spiralis]|uniref:Mevalonate kinase n=2 Tax=Coemansia TaxID=4863 RepID=A0A9W8G1P8_9FUNG|nr:ribosomal protein S5 domain 2-type protein [Coemansia spiralis]KAJ1989447.1 Mevalonate kinase [Coemansia umbellata]KAJ2620344.1 Mevalonate kinase [Coemansia sp. RSA 1358]KAJ2669662.1 Mevalonate kinase [Coemansia spiralis]